MLTSVDIHNFKLFKSLHIESFKRVNLIIGKNNIGKSSLLEAIWLLIHKAHPAAINFIFGQRGELQYNSVNREVFDEQKVLALFEGLFYGREIAYQAQDAIKISGTFSTSTESIQLYFDTIEPPNLFDEFFEVGLKISVGEQSEIFRLDKLNRPYHPTRPNGNNEKNNVRFIQTEKLQENQLFSLWSNIALTDREEDMIKALQLIAPEISKITFVEDERSRYRTRCYAKLVHQEKRVLLSSMGDGINHLLAITLHLLNCEKGTLFIEEYETGLHWAVQLDLWKIILTLAKKLEVQVFATTHSTDTLRSLTRAAEQLEETESLQVIKLSKKREHIKAILYPEEQLTTAIEENIELR